MMRMRVWGWLLVRALAMPAAAFAQVACTTRLVTMRAGANRA